MFVILITDIKTNTLCAVVEHPDNVSQNDVVRHWIGMQGLPETSFDNFRASYSPVTPWSSLSRAFEPYSHAPGDFARI